MKPRFERTSVLACGEQQGLEPERAERSGGPFWSEHGQAARRTADLRSRYAKSLMIYQPYGAPTKRSGFLFLLDFSTVLGNKHYSVFEMISGQNSRKI
jgi:hypothetical protein